MGVVMRTRMERVVVAVWDNLPLPVQHLVFNRWPGLAWRLDELAAVVDRRRAR